MNKDKIYKFGELTWVVGYDELNRLMVLPVIYSGKFITDIYGCEVYCENIKEGVAKYLNEYRLTVAPNVSKLINENSIISNIDVFKLCMNGLKAKATVFANNFHYQSMVFNAEDYYNLKIANKEFNGEELHKLSLKTTKTLCQYNRNEIKVANQKEEDEHTNTL